MKNNNIPEFLLCSTPELARQVLEKIERESDLMIESYGISMLPTQMEMTIFPVVIDTLNNKLGRGEEEWYRKNKGATNFTKAEDYLNNNYMTEKTWENLQEGWVLEHSRDEFEILAIRGRVIDLSSSNDFNLAGGRYTKEELINGGFKIKGASEDKPKEIKEAILLLESIPVDYYGSSDRTDICKAIEMLKKLK